MAKRLVFEKKLCTKCGERADARPELDVCEKCYQSQKAVARVRAYRARAKRAGLPNKYDRSPEAMKRHNDKHNKAKQERYRAKKAAQKAAEPPPLAPADKIARKETAAKLTKRELGMLTADEAVQVELARRELARRDLLFFIQRRLPRYKAGWFHQTLCRELEAFSDQVANELSPRVMFFAPPRHGKSEVGSINFPAWHLGRYPWMQYIGVSYSAPLAYKFSRAVQDIIETEDYKALYPDVRIRRDMSSVEEWGLMDRREPAGVYVAAGVGGPISGKGAHVLGIDDVIKNREEADSALVRRQIQDWYTSTAYTRLMPGGGVMIINTRWNYDDLCGWLLQMMEAADKIAQQTGEWPDDYDKWTVVDFPAIALKDEQHRAKGEPLHPERYSLKSLLRIKNTIGDRDFNALYQQRPVPDEGEYFTKSMLRYFEGDLDLRDFTLVAAGDLAISKKEYADWSVFVVAGVNANDDIYIFDVVRGKWDSMELIDRIFEIQHQYKPSLFGLEQGQIDKAIGPFLEKRRMEEKLFSLNVEPLPPGKRDKELRARPIQGRMRQGKVYIRRAHWTDDFVSELLRFPGAAKDDQVDALAWIGQMMNHVRHVPRDTGTIASWRDRIDSLGDQGLVSRHPAMAA